MAQERHVFLRASALAFVAALVFVVNPAWLAGCAGTVASGREFSFDEGDLRALVQGPYLGKVTLEDGSFGLLRLYVEQASQPFEPFAWLERALVPQAQACGGRTFVKGAAACVSVTTMPLTGTVTLQRLDAQGQLVETTLDEQPLRGEAKVLGSALGYTTLELSWSATERVVLVSEDGASFKPEAVWWRGGQQVAVSDLYKPTR